MIAGSITTPRRIIVVDHVTGEVYYEGKAAYMPRSIMHMEVVKQVKDPSSEATFVIVKDDYQRLEF